MKKNKILNYVILILAIVLIGLSSYRICEYVFFRWQ